MLVLLIMIVQTSQLLPRDSIHNFFPFKIPAFDFLLIHRKLSRSARQCKWSSVLLNYASQHRPINPTNHIYPKFLRLDILLCRIIAFTRFRTGHSLLPHHSFHLVFNSFPFCILHFERAFCDFNHIIFNCPTLFPSELLLFSFLLSVIYSSPNLLLYSRSVSLIPFIMLVS